MKRINIFYWFFTGMLIPSLGYGSVMELMGNPQSIEVIISLGYPAYLSPFLGVARILALIAIFIPKFPRIKEWAYAGLVFDVIGAIYSQIAFGNPLTYTIFPIIILGVIFGSYYFYHKRLTINS
jgi:hypothetical protein